MSNERAEQWQRRSMALRAAQDRYARDADWDRCRRAQKIRVDTYNRWCDEITKPKRDRRLILEALAYGREARAREALAAYQAAMQSDHEPPPIQRDYGDETTNILAGPWGRPSWGRLAHLHFAADGEPIVTRAA